MAPEATSWADQYPQEHLVPYDPTWAARGQELLSSVRQILGEDWLGEHAGSTSVPGIAAKPVIDLVLRVPAGRDLLEAVQPLVSAGWSPPVVVGDHWAVFRSSAERREAIGHIFTAAQWPEAHIRLFARWLRSHPEDARRYEELKQGVVAAGVWGPEYTRQKADFVREIVNASRREQGLTALAWPP